MKKKTYNEYVLYNHTTAEEVDGFTWLSENQVKLLLEDTEYSIISFSSTPIEVEPNVPID